MHASIQKLQIVGAHSPEKNCMLMIALCFGVIDEENNGENQIMMMPFPLSFEVFARPSKLAM